MKVIKLKKRKFIKQYKRDSVVFHVYLSDGVPGSLLTKQYFTAVHNADVRYMDIDKNILKLRDDINNSTDKKVQRIEVTINNNLGYFRLYHLIGDKFIPHRELMIHWNSKGFNCRSHMIQYRDNCIHPISGKPYCVLWYKDIIAYDYYRISESRRTIDNSIHKFELLLNDIESGKFNKPTKNISYTAHCLDVFLKD
ncbi:hypothetical protein RaK2_00302 [Klebsiella phage vB_KleM_RaK2]|uniref:Uncharacterized protein n=1 Tax=Klebsiella phage vB_KleM_RaK2 TaxID=1147094 RepID=H6X4A9_9CAUD|nr:hypothetical protein F403_gp233 [Klebsiella phage vB_KleM_RaK2]AFA44575.1 hypothetical protein RaK2_00302 [Klebsiella phage vB_KleM_RaK2]